MVKLVHIDSSRSGGGRRGIGGRHGRGGIGGRGVRGERDGSGGSGGRSRRGSNGSYGGRGDSGVVCDVNAVSVCDVNSVSVCDSNDWEREVLSIKHNVVCESTRRLYEAQNIKLLHFLFSNTGCRDILKKRVVRRYKAGESHDSVDGVSFSSHKSKLREAMVQSLDSSSDNFSCPFHISKFSFKYFSQYLTCRKPGDGGYFSNAHYDGMRSSMHHLYRESGSTLPEAFNNELSSFMQGLRRTVAKSKQESGGRIEEG